MSLYSAALTSSDTLAARIVDSLWEDMNDDGHRFFCWLPDPLLTQCGKTGVATAKSKLFVTCVEFAPLREEVLQVLSGFDHSENVAFVQQTELYSFCACCFDSPAPYTRSVLLRPGTFPLC